MKRVYEAANNVEAHMIVHLLNAADIEAHVQGEHLQSGAGELPLGGLVAVVVADEDTESAQRLIQEWEARTRSNPDTTPAPAAKGGLRGQLIAFIVGGFVAGSIVWSIHHGPISPSRWV